MPDFFGDHGGGDGPGRGAIAAIEQAADEGAIEAIDAEEVAGDGDADAAAGIVIADERGEVAERGELAQGAGLVAEVQVFLIGDAAGSTLQARFGDDADEGVGILVDMRLDHHAVDHGKDAGIDADADGEGEDHHEGEQRVAADDAAAVENVFPEGGEENGGIAAVFGDLLFPGLWQEAARGDHAGGEHLGRALRCGGEGGVVFDGGNVQRHDVGFERFLPEHGIFGPLGDALAAPSAPEEHERGEEREEGGELAGGAEQHGRNGGEIDHGHGGAEEQQPDHLLARKVGTGEGQLAPIAEEAFEAEEGDEHAERGDGEGAEPAENGDGGRQAGQINGDDSAGDDEALYGGEPGVRGLPDRRSGTSNWPAR